jgi:hypothetical protein
MRELIERLDARDGYLGASTDELAPHRKVPLLFDGDGEDEAALRPVLAKLVPLLPSLQDKLHTDPSVVNPKNRLRECVKCNSHSRAHECPFEDSAAPRRPAPPYQQLPAGMLAAGLGAGRQPRSMPSAAIQSDKMCRSWRHQKKCPRLDAGRPCQFEHPPDHLPQRQTCFAFRDYGRCNRGDQCSFAHASPQPAPPEQPQQPATRQAAAAPPANAAPAHAERKEDEAAPTASADGQASAAKAKKPPGRPRKRAHEENSAEPAAAAAAAGAPASSAASLSDANSWSALADNATEEELKDNEERAAKHGRQPRSRSPAPSLPVSSLGSLGSPASATKRQALSRTLSASNTGGGAAATQNVSPSRRPK